jgi:hypothetical protein
MAVASADSVVKINKQPGKHNHFVVTDPGGTLPTAAPTKRRLKAINDKESRFVWDGAYSAVDANRGVVLAVPLAPALDPTKLGKAAVNPLDASDLDSGTLNITIDDGSANGIPVAVTVVYLDSP